MEAVQLVADSGRPVGTRPSRRLRNEDRIPAVVYGHNVASTPVSVERRALRSILRSEAGANALIDLAVGSDTHLAVIRDIQRDTLRNRVSHVDFVVVDREVELRAEIPIELTGTATKVNQTDGGTIDHVLHELTVSAKPADIPAHLTIDISELDIDDIVRVGDVALPPGVTTEVDPEEPVAAARIIRVALADIEAIEGEEVEDEEGEGEEGEGEEAEGEGGDDGGDEA